MFFYRIRVKTETWKEDKKTRNKDERRELLEAACEKLNRNEDENTFVFGVKCDAKGFVVGVVSEEKKDERTVAREVAGALGAMRGDAEEVTYSAVRKMIDSAWRGDFVEDGDAVKERFGLDSAYENYRMKVGEKLIGVKRSREALYKAADSAVATDTLVPELDRIFSGRKTGRCSGHPVHYLIKTDSSEAVLCMLDVLTEALYGACRLMSRRISMMSVPETAPIVSSCTDALYGCAEGGTVVFYMPRADVNDGEFCTETLRDNIVEICRLALKYRNRTLTVIVVPRECADVKRIIYENVGAMTFVELSENLADKDRAVGFFKSLCKKEGIRPDKKLTLRLEDGKQYLPDELRAIFDEWYNDKMKTTVFPQYKELAGVRREMAKEPPRGRGVDELNKLIGLAGAKDVIKKALNYYKIQKVFADRGVSRDRVAMHMVFTGNPGTAKTTVARLFARIMKENGLLSSGHLVEVGRSDLVGKYVGWTAQIVKEKFKKAMGGVLFIDEAYSLVEGKAGLYGDEAINTIVQEMENRRDDLVVIFAGYPREMEEFLEKNPGLRSRIAFHVPFADYDSSELCEIARVIAESKGVSLSDGAVRKLGEVFEDARHEPDFGNGRYVRNVIELSKMNLASRIVAMDPDEVTEMELRLITEEDIDAPKTAPKETRRRIGFIA